MWSKYKIQMITSTFFHTISKFYCIAFIRIKVKRVIWPFGDYQLTRCFNSHFCNLTTWAVSVSSSCEMIIFNYNVKTFIICLPGQYPDYEIIMNLIHNASKFQHLECNYFFIFIIDCTVFWTEIVSAAKTWAFNSNLTWTLFRNIYDLISLLFTKV